MSHIHIDVEHLSYAYENGNNVLSDLSFHAGEDDCIGIIGANGVGKSTLLKMLVGLILDYSGSIRVEEIPVEKKTLSLIREKIGYLFQDSDSQLFLSTAYEDVAFGPLNYGLPQDEVDRRVDQALAQVGAMHLKNKHTYQMSGGEKKLIAIATILSMNPDIILMDEPSVALDPKNRRNLIQLINSWKHLRLIASHDLDLIMDTCNRTILIADGKIIRDGDTKEILTDEKLLDQCGLELPLSLYHSLRIC